MSRHANRTRHCVLLLGALLVAATARADSLGPGQAHFADSIVDLAAARVTRKAATKAKCDYQDSGWERARRRHEASPRPPGTYFVDTTRTRVLFGDRFGKKTPPVVRDLASGAERVLHDGYAAALGENDKGELVGVLAVDEPKHELRWLDPASGRARWTLPHPRLRGSAAAVLVDGDQLVVATFHRNATGSRLLAVDVATGALRWEADVQQLHVGHSEYYNEVTLERRGSSIVLHGTEAAGCYLEIFLRRTGARRLALIDQLWGK